MLLVFSNVFILLIFGSCSSEILSSDNCQRVGLGEHTPYKKYPEMKFYLYTRQNFLEGQNLIIGNLSTIENSNFNKDWPVRIFVHGWRGDHRSCVGGMLKDAYLTKGDFNVIIIDWNDWASRDYKLAVAVIKQAGKYLGDFTIYLNRLGVPFDNIYLIGHSLGAHVTGEAGAYIKPAQYDTIFALDAAGPSFEGAPIEKRLDPTDAKYVESISTDIYNFGYSKPVIGHASIFPNYGRSVQPHCQSERRNPLCSHIAAVKFLAESIVFHGQFCAKRTSWSDIYYRRTKRDGFHNNCLNYMGGEPSHHKNGIFFLATSRWGPFPDSEFINAL